MNSVSLHTLTEFHARHNCTLTALMVRPPHRDDDSKKKFAVTERDIVGLAEDSKIVYFAAMADLDDDLTLSRHMIKRSVSTGLDIALHTLANCLLFMIFSTQTGTL